jgi:hypothetical protein
MKHGKFFLGKPLPANPLRMTGGELPPAEKTAGFRAF